MAAISRNERYRQVISIIVEAGFGTALDQIGLRAPWIASLRRGRTGGVEESCTAEQRVSRAMERLGPCTRLGSEAS